MTTSPNENPLEQCYTFFETCLRELNEIDPSANQLLFLAFTKNKEAPVVFVTQDFEGDDLYDAAAFLQREFLHDIIITTVTDTREFDDTFDEDQMTMEDYDYE